MHTKNTPEELITEAQIKKLYYEEVCPESNMECEFLSCHKHAILLLEDFYVCTSHGFRLIQCLTEKTIPDSIDPNQVEND